jgi:leader peptidase (prepilin peptidase)/N-methyltransferase
MVFVLFATGLLLGSFASVLIGRWPHWRGVVAGRSACTACGHALGVADLVPLVSWAGSRGTCRYCGARVSAWYPVYELSMAGVLVAYGLLVGVRGWAGVIDVAALILLTTLFFFDLRLRVLPDVLVALLACVGVGRQLAGGHSLVAPVAVGVGTAAAFFLLLLFWERVLKRDGVGYGDVKLAVALGLLLGLPAMVFGTVIAVWAGALLGIVLLASHKAGMRTELPFGSFWVAAAALFILLPSLSDSMSHLLWV